MKQEEDKILGRPKDILEESLPSKKEVFLNRIGNIVGSLFLVLLLTIFIILVVGLLFVCIDIINQANGELQNEDEFDYIEGEYIKQTINGGYTGDEFAGTCAIKISDKEYFQFNYSM